MKGLIGVAIVGIFVTIIITLEWLQSRRWDAKRLLRERIFQPDDKEIEDENDY